MSRFLSSPLKIRVPFFLPLCFNQESKKEKKGKSVLLRNLIESFKEPFEEPFKGTTQEPRYRVRM